MKYVYFTNKGKDPINYKKVNARSMHHALNKINDKKVRLMIAADYFEKFPTTCLTAIALLGYKRTTGKDMPARDINNEN